MLRARPALAKPCMHAQVFRQRDVRFVSLLDQIRSGNGDAAAAQLAQLCQNQLPEMNGIVATELCVPHCLLFLLCDPSPKLRFKLGDTCAVPVWLCQKQLPELNGTVATELCKPNCLVWAA